jgi:hypothetical protein
LVTGSNNGGAIYFGVDRTGGKDFPTAAIETSWGGSNIPQIAIGVTREFSRRPGASLVLDFGGGANILQGTNSRLFVQGGTGNVGIATTNPGASLAVKDRVLLRTRTAETTSRTPKKSDGLGLRVGALWKQLRRVCRIRARRLGRRRWRDPAKRGSCSQLRRQHWDPAPNRPKAKFEIFWISAWWRKRFSPFILARPPRVGSVVNPTVHNGHLTFRCRTYCPPGRGISRCTRATQSPRLVCLRFQMSASSAACTGQTGPRSGDAAEHRSCRLFLH